MIDPTIEVLEDHPEPTGWSMPRATLQHPLQTGHWPEWAYDYSTWDRVANHYVHSAYCRKCDH